MKILILSHTIIIPHYSNFYERLLFARKPVFMRVEKILAEREGFEPSVQVLARTNGSASPPAIKPQPSEREAFTLHLSLECVDCDWWQVAPACAKTCQFVGRVPTKSPTVPPFLESESNRSITSVSGEYPQAFSLIPCKADKFPRATAVARRFHFLRPTH